MLHYEHLHVFARFPTRTLLVRDLPFSCTTEDLESFFRDRGFEKISKSFVCFDRRNCPLHYGYILFESEEDVERALKEVHGQRLRGRNLRLQHFDSFAASQVAMSGDIHVYFRSISDKTPLVTEETLRTFLEQFGEVEYVIVRSHGVSEDDDHQQRGYGFATFADPSVHSTVVERVKSILFADVVYDCTFSHRKPVHAPKKTYDASKAIQIKPPHTMPVPPVQYQVMTAPPPFYITHTQAPYPMHLPPPPTLSPPSLIQSSPPSYPETRHGNSGSNPHHQQVAYAVTSDRSSGYATGPSFAPYTVSAPVSVPHVTYSYPTPVYLPPSGYPTHSYGTHPQHQRSQMQQAEQPVQPVQIRLSPPAVSVSPPQPIVLPPNYDQQQYHQEQFERQQKQVFAVPSASALQYSPPEVNLQATIPPPLLSFQEQHHNQRLVQHISRGQDLNHQPSTHQTQQQQVYVQHHPQHSPQYHPQEQRLRSHYQSSYHLPPTQIPSSSSSSSVPPPPQYLHAGYLHPDSHQNQQHHMR